MTRRLLRLRKPRGKQCHPLPDLVEDRRAWDQTAHFYPDIGKDDLVQIGTAVELASEMRQAYPSMYDE